MNEKMMRKFVHTFLLNDPFSSSSCPIIETLLLCSAAQGLANGEGAPGGGGGGGPAGLTQATPYPTIPYPGIGKLQNLFVGLRLQ